MSETIELANVPPVGESECRILKEHSTEFDLHHPETGEAIPTVFTPSIYTDNSPLSLKDVDIRLFPVSQLIRHEVFLRKGLKKVTFSEEGHYRWNDAPMVGVENSDGNIVIIDGSTRLRRIQSLSKYVMNKHNPRHTPVFPVQVVDYDNDNLILDIWESHHPRRKILTKQHVMRKVLAGEFVEPKQTKFGVKIGNKIVSIAQTQGEVNISMSSLLGINLIPENIDNGFSLMTLLG